MAPQDDAVLGLAATDTDAGAGGVGEAIPTEVHSTFVLEALYAARMLAGIVPNPVEDLTAKAGDTVKVTRISARTPQGPIAEGNALTDNATTITAVSLTLEKFGDFDLVNREVFEDQTIWDEADFLRNMGEALAEQVDQEVYDAAEGATPTATPSALATAGDLADLYDKVVDQKAALKKQKVRPSHLIVGPDQEAQFLKDADEGIKLTQISVRDGELLAVAGLEAIVTPLANPNSATLDEVQAILVDARRALGEVWGRRPETVVDRVTNAHTDQVRLITWLRYATEVIDLDAIGHVVNPAA